MNNEIEFKTWNDDAPMFVQLEPEAFGWTTSKSSILKFVAKEIGEDFHWSFTSSTDENGEHALQVCPDGTYRCVDVYLNGKPEYLDEEFVI